MASSTVTIVQIIFIVAIALMAFIAGVLPTKIPWCKNSVNVLGIANAFSGGVFLAIAFMHIMPEVSENYNEYLEDHEHEHEDELGPLRHGGDDDHFPLPFALFFIGYAFILLIDKVVFDTHSLVDGHGGHNHHGHDLVQQNFVQNVKSSFTKFQKMVSDDDIDKVNGDGCQTKAHEASINESIKAYLSRNDKFAVRMSTALKKKKTAKMTSKTFTGNLDALIDEEDDQAHLFADANNIKLKNGEQNQDEIANLKSPAKSWCKCNLTPVVLMIALSAHSLFEGIAVGL